MFYLPTNKPLAKPYLFSGDTKNMMTQERDKWKITLTLNRTPVQNVDRVRIFALEFFGGDFDKKKSFRFKSLVKPIFLLLKNIL